MIARYTRPEMGRIWSDQHKYECWLAVELAASEALSEMGEVPAEEARALRAHARLDLKRIEAIEREVRHDVIAFTTTVAESMAAAGAPEAARWFHYGMTSNDVVDTAQALLVRDASHLIEKALVIFGEILDVRAAQPLYVEAVARHEVAQSLDLLERAFKPAGAAPQCTKKPGA